VAADVLSKLGSRRALVPADVFIQDLRKPSIKLLDPDNPEPPPHGQNSAPPCNVLMSKKEDDWCKPFIDLILDQLVPNDKTEREREYHAMNCQLRRDWYRPIQKSRLYWRLDEVHPTIRRPPALS
jgi:hypothetical protein